MLWGLPCNGIYNLLQMSESPLSTANGVLKWFVFFYMVYSACYLLRMSESQLGPLNEGCLNLFSNYCSSQFLLSNLYVYAC